MDIINILSYPGRNIFSHRPVIKAVVNIGCLFDTPTNMIKDFNNNLLAMFPGLKSHYCSCGHEGGLVERLDEGTYLTHVTEHLVLELQSLAGYDIRFGKSRVMEEPSTYFIVFEYRNEKFAIECLITAVAIVNSLIKGILPDIDEIMRHLRKADAETVLGPSTEAICCEAEKRKIPVTNLGNTGVLQLGYGKYSRLVEASLTDSPCCISVDMAGNKHLTKYILKNNGIPVPHGDIAYTVQSACSAAAQIGFPVVVKPFDANQGKGVTLNISNETGIASAFNEAINYSRAVIVEEYIKGRDYRLLVVGGRVAAAAERIPPSVAGDGIHTVKELVEIENENPLRGENHEKPLTRIKLDYTSLQVLFKAGIDESHIPPAGTLVYLRHNGNLSTGGTSRECTDEIHPYNADLTVRAAELLGLDLAGIDITAEDIKRPLVDGNGAIIEVNAAPGLRMHLYPAAGKPRDVAADIVNMLFPAGKPFTIPIVSVTGTNGKTTVTRLITHTLELTGKTVGMTSTGGIHIGGNCILKGDNTGPASAAVVLSDKTVEAAVLETARGGIIRKGLGYDLADVGVIVNISEDHLGLDGVNTLDDLAGVKSLVAEAVKDNGYAILNADDGMTPFFMKRIRSKLILFSVNHRNLLVADHIKSGGRAVFIRSGSIFESENGYETVVARVTEIPITLGGAASCNVENSLAAVSALYALDVSADIIRAGLRTFKPDIVTNPGRLNIFDMGDFKVMLDYGHNPAGYGAVIDCIRKMTAGRYVGIIGMPGDRTNESIRNAGLQCGRIFSHIYIKEDNDRRGRNPGEVAGILYDAVMSTGMKEESISVEYSETAALKTALLEAQPGDLIVMFYEEFTPALELIEGFMRSEFVYETGRNSYRKHETGDGQATVNKERVG